MVERRGNWDKVHLWLDQSIGNSQFDGLNHVIDEYGLTSRLVYFGTEVKIVITNQDGLAFIMKMDINEIKDERGDIVPNRFYPETDEVLSYLTPLQRFHALTAMSAISELIVNIYYGYYDPEDLSDQSILSLINYYRIVEQRHIDAGLDF